MLPYLRSDFSVKSGVKVTQLSRNESAMPGPGLQCRDSGTCLCEWQKHTRRFCRSLGECFSISTADSSVGARAAFEPDYSRRLQRYGVTVTVAVLLTPS